MINNLKDESSYSHHRVLNRADFIPPWSSGWFICVRQYSTFLFCPLFMVYIYRGSTLTNYARQTHCAFSCKSTIGSGLDSWLEKVSSIPVLYTKCNDVDPLYSGHIRLLKIVSAITRCSLYRDTDFFK